MPISLLTALKLSGTMPESQAEQITLDPVLWRMERPACLMGIGRRLEKLHTDDWFSAIFGVHVAEYKEDSLTDPFNGRDGVELSVYVNASVNLGFLVYISHHVQPMDANSTAILYIGDQEWPQKYNVTVTDRELYGSVDKEAYARAKVTGSHCYWLMLTPWVFHDENSVDHRLKITSEILYYTGSGYRNVSATFIVEVFVSAGNDFDSPEIREIGFGSFLASIDSHYDPVDLYKIWLEEGQSIIVELVPLSLSRPDLDYYPDLDLYLYDPDKTLAGSSCSRGNVSEQLEFTANKTCFYFIKIVSYQRYRGTYILRIRPKN